MFILISNYNQETATKLISRGFDGAQLIEISISDP
jgi:hypothetical protein